jgi:hypothetical protein
LRSTLEEFDKELGELRAFLASIKPVNTALAGHEHLVIRQYLTLRRRFDYAAFIVALYAAFETFVESLVSSYATLIASRTTYAALPTPLVRKHMVKSAELLSKGRLGEGRYSGISEHEVVKNLFDCVSGAESYSLNAVAVIAHDLNLRYGELIAIFAGVGIENISEQARRLEPLTEWYRALNSLETAPVEVPAVTIKQRIAGMVDRRNQVAHRGGALELLGAEEMAELVGFVDALAHSLFVVTAGHYIRGRYIDHARLTPLTMTEGPYRDGYVVVVARPTHRLFVGQAAFVPSGNGIRWGRILELRVEDATVTSVELDSTAATVGIAVDFRCPDNARLYTLEHDDDIAWAPSAPAADAPTETTQQLS